jgi:hypothetical protein
MKVGDVVMCIHDYRKRGGFFSSYFGPEPELGKSYTVAAVSGCCATRISLKEILDIMPEHFLFKAKTVICIDCRKAYPSAGWIARKFIKLGDVSIQDEEVTATKKFLEECMS